MARCSGSSGFLKPNVGGVWVPRFVRVRLSVEMAALTECKEVNPDSLCAKRLVVKMVNLEPALSGASLAARKCGLLLFSLRPPVDGTLVGVPPARIGKCRTQDPVVRRDPAEAAVDRFAQLVALGIPPLWEGYEYAPVRQSGLSAAHAAGRITEGRVRVLPLLCGSEHANPRSSRYATYSLSSRSVSSRCSVSLPL